MIFDAITWTASPIIFSAGPLTVRWYGLMFALAFIVGYKIMEFVYKKEKMPETELDRLSIHMILAVIIGARLGHVLFYGPHFDEYNEAGKLIEEGYFSHPLNIFKVWEGGLASHGAAIGILVALFIYSRKPVVPSYMWILDRIILTVPIGGFFVRMGNLFNSEIYGHITNLPWAFKFPIRNSDNKIIAFTEPRHPTQLYEGLAYVLIFAFLFSLYRRYNTNLRPGYLFGLFLILLFGVRLFVEFYKENQVAFENNLPLNMGQILSIPFIIIGIFILIRSYRLTPGEKI